MGGGDKESLKNEAKISGLNSKIDAGDFLRQEILDKKQTSRDG